MRGLIPKLPPKNQVSHEAKTKLIKRKRTPKKIPLAIFLTIIKTIPAIKKIAIGV
jgi:hypothetical protein